MCLDPVCLGEKHGFSWSTFDEQQIRMSEISQVIWAGKINSLVKELEDASVLLLKQFKLCWMNSYHICIIFAFPSSASFPIKWQDLQ